MIALILLPLAAALGFCEYKWRILTRPYDSNSAAHRTAALLSVVLCLLMVGAMYSMLFSSSEPVAYPLDGPVANYSPYVQQYDAWLKGQVELDWEVDPSLLELENVYDPAQRPSRAFYLWDRALYNGKYYSYFGITPLLTVYAPYHLLTGSLPSDGFVMTVLTLIAAVFMPLALWQWAWNFAPKTPASLLVLTAPGVFLASMILLIMRGYTPFYYIASVSGCAFLSLFLYLCLRAYAARRRATRIILWTLAGIAYGLVFQSRLNIALIAAFLVIPGLWFFIIGRKRDGEEAPGRGRLYAVLSELAALGVPVLLFLCGSMIYNAMRFSGPLDFGSAYQLTVADTSTYKVRITDLPYAIYHYLLAQPGISKIYPYVNFNYVAFNGYGHYVYRDAGLGLLSMPLDYLLILSPAVICSQKQTNRRRIMLLAGIVGIFVTALLDFCLGGIIYRYTCDLTVVGALISGIVLLTLYNSAAESGRTWLRYAVYTAAVLFLAVSAAECIRITLIADNGNIVKYGEEVAAYLEKLLPFAPVAAD